MFAQLGFGICGIQCGFMAGDGVLSYYILLSFSGFSYSCIFLLPLVLLTRFLTQMPLQHSCWFWAQLQHFSSSWETTMETFGLEKQHCFLTRFPANFLFSISSPLCFVLAQGTLIYADTTFILL